MTEITPATMITAWIVIGVVVFLLSPHFPAWVGFALPLGIAAYGVVEILRDGPEASEIALVLVFAILAAAVWWRDLRGAPREGRPPGP